VGILRAAGRRSEQGYTAGINEAAARSDPHPPCRANTQPEFLLLIDFSDSLAEALTEYNC
jgi:hypothetical protein